MDHDASQTPPPSSTFDDDEAPDAAASSGSPPRFALAIGLTLLVIAAFALAGKLSGTGWFGYRSWLYEGGELYVLNMNDFPVMASVDGFEAVEVPARNAQRLELIGGTSEVEVREASGELIERHEVTLDGAHALLKVKPGEECIAVVDVSGYYRGERGEAPALLRPMTQGESLRVFESQNIIWPRKPFPSEVDPKLGPPRWLSIIGCALLDDEEYLIGYLGYQIEEQFAKMGLLD